MEIAIEKKKTYQRKTVSVCPECLRTIPAEIREENGQIIIEKNCPQHGNFKDVIWSDADLYKKFKDYERPGFKVKNPEVKLTEGCPKDCGLCELHESHTALALIDITNRCNLNCPICFANANAMGYVVEPTFEQIVEIMKHFREMDPPAVAIQFSGGEPTVREDLPELIRKAKELGFTQIQIATNGVRMAQSADYVRTLVEAGLNTAYLQFDGVTEKPYTIARGKNLFEIKQKALENCRKGGLKSIVLVPTVVKGVNDDQLGEIIKFAINNSDIVRGIVFQPVSLTGRIPQDQLKSMRITSPEVMRKIEEQTGGALRVSDFYSINCLVDFGRIIAWYSNAPMVEFTNATDCGLATYIVLNEDRTFYPITELVDVDGLISDARKIWKLTNDGKKKGFLTRLRVKLALYRAFKRHVKRKDKTIELIKDVLGKGEKKRLAKFSGRTLLIGSMHFQDPYNFDLERVKKCVIHYGVHTGKEVRVIPFCAMNTLFRDEYWSPKYATKMIRKSSQKER
ncbi:MAG: radical SAM protein [Candidatus Korarchaeota archaeon]